MYLPAFPAMAAYFHVPIVKIETTVTVFLFGMAFGQLFIGPLSDTWGRRKPLRIGLLIYIGAAICCMLTSSFTLFLVLRFIQGLAGSSCQVISRALVNDIYGTRDAAHVFTLLQIIMGVSPILAPMTGGILSDAATWKYLFLIMAVISGAGLLGCLTVLPAGKAAETERGLNAASIRLAYIHSIQHPAFINYALVRAISNSAAFSFVTASPFVFMELYGITKKQFGLLFSGLALCIICAGLLNTRLLRRFEPRLITAYAISVQVVTGLAALVILYMGGPLSVMIALFALFLSMLGLILPNATALYLAAIPAHNGAASALVGSMSYLSAFLVTSLLSFIHNETAFPMLFMMWACSLAAFYCLRHQKETISAR